jgi:hypothetical protein
MIKVCSFSGGKTSAYMGAECDHDVYVFANTGLEHPKTLEFVNKCDKYFGWGLVWLEAVFHQEKGVGTTHKIVDFGSACRDQSLFGGMCAKYGIPNKAYPHCTRELKQQPIQSYLRSIGLKKKDYQMAVGIRYDEKERESNEAKKFRIYYPLIEMGITKLDVNLYWESMPFNLEIEPYLGNCVGCWKKSDRKLFTIIRQDINIFLPLGELERKYGRVNNIDGVTNRVFWRRNRSTDQMITEATKQLDMFWDARSYDPDAFDECGESCEVF